MEMDAFLPQGRWDSSFTIFSVTLLNIGKVSHQNSKSYNDLIGRILKGRFDPCNQSEISGSKSLG